MLPALLGGVGRPPSSRVQQTPRLGTITLLENIASELSLPLHNIDCNSSFICNGGDSLAALKVVMACRSQGIVISAATIMGCDSLNDLIRNHYHLSPTDLSCSTGPNVVCETVHPQECQSSLLTSTKDSMDYRRCQATDMQLTLIRGSKSLPGCNIIRYYETYHTEDIPQVKNAWRAVVSAEPIFRTRFRILKDQYYLLEEDEAVFIWEEVTAKSREVYASALKHDDVDTDFIGVAFKVVHLESKDPQESTIVWKIHHALIDAYSSVLILNKHRNALAGHPLEPGPSFVSLVEQTTSLRNTWQSSRTFWATEEKKLRDAKSELQLSTSGLPFNPVYARMNISLNVDHRHLLQYAKKTGVTVATIFYAAWAITLSHYVDSNHVCFGVVLSGRSLPHPDAGTVVGPLIHTVPFRVSLEPFENVSDYLAAIFRHSLELDSAQWSMSAQAGANMYSALNVHFESRLLTDSPLDMLREPQTIISSGLPLSAHIGLDGDLELQYHEHAFLANDIKKLGELFTKAIKTLLNPKLTIDQCRYALLSDDVEHFWANGNCSSERTTTRSWLENLVDLFNRESETNAGIIAIKKGSSAITYLELDLKATTVAHYLVDYVRPGQVVCVHADRTINWIIAIYGVLKAGGIYCPLEESLPRDVRNRNFCQSGSSTFLAGDTHCKSYKPSSCKLSFSVEEILLGGGRLTLPPSKEKRRGGLRTIQPDNGAYLCFTSGSTGMPKGILVSHRSLVAFQSDFDVRLRSRPGWQIGQVMSPAFDGSIHEIFSALSYGSTLVLRDSADPVEHLSNVDAAVLTPSIASILDPTDFPSLKVIYLVGEAVSQNLCDKWASKVTTYNMYGPTETTCGATIKELRCQRPVTLGRPNPSTRIYVLNSERRFVPPGVVGEIYIAGVQVSQGYVNNPAETASHFLADTIHTRDGECADPTEDRMYGTGDRGKWDEQGELQFCGRKDRQIKLRGFRVDLDDIEARIQASIPGCAAAAVVVCNNGSLVAQILPSDLPTSGIRELLSEVLPSYAVPRHIVAVSKFPKSNVGKLDYKAIQASMNNTRLALGAPKRKSEHLDEELSSQAFRAWGEILGLDGASFSTESNFLALGGNSLLQLHLANRLSARLGYVVPLASIIQSPTLGDLIDRLKKYAQTERQLPKRIHQALSVSPIEQDWFEKYQLRGSSSSFNVNLCFRLGPNVNLLKLQDSWDSCLARHNVFRYHFQRLNGSIRKTFSETPPKVQKLDWIDIPREINLPFDLEHDSLVRVTLTSTHLLFVASHIICDYTSLNNILHEASYGYFDMSLKEPIQISDGFHIAVQPTTQDFEFWRDCLKDLPSPNYSIGAWPSRSSYSGSSRVCKIPTQMFYKLRQFILSQMMTAHHVSLAAVCLALQYHSNTIDIVLGAPHLGRNSSEAQDIVGLFLEPLPVRICYDFNRSSAGMKDFLRTVQDSSQNALGRALPWNMLLETLGIGSSFPDSNLFDVMVSYHDRYGTMGMAGIDAKPLCTWAEGSKFKLMIEFIVANNNSLLLRLEYSDECFDEDSIGMVEILIVRALGMILDGCSSSEIRHSLAIVRKEPEKTACFNSRKFYGVKLEDL